MFYIYIILGILVIHCTIYYLNIDIFNFFTRSKSNSENNDNDDVSISPNTNEIVNEMSNSIETSINELKNLNQYIDNELGQTTFC
jgi:hypothetical protein